MSHTKKIRKLESRVDDLEFTVQYLINMVDEVNTRYATLTDALTRKTLERLSQEQSGKTD